MIESGNQIYESVDIYCREQSIFLSGLCTQDPAPGTPGGLVLNVGKVSVATSEGGGNEEETTPIQKETRCNVEKCDWAGAGRRGGSCISTPCLSLPALLTPVPIPHAPCHLVSKSHLIVILFEVKHDAKF